MLAADEDALICDLAETYGVLDYKALPPKLVAVLSAGLRENSRIKTKLSGTEADLDTRLKAVIADGVNWLVWAQTEDGAKNRNKPASILAAVLGEDTARKNVGFDSPEDFEAARKAILGRD